jgi:hypothetical protein
MTNEKPTNPQDDDGRNRIMRRRRVVLLCLALGSFLMVVMAIGLSPIPHHPEDRDFVWPGFLGLIFLTGVVFLAATAFVDR